MIARLTGLILAVFALCAWTGAAPAAEADAGKPRLVKDIWPGKKGSWASQTIRFGGQLLFEASSPKTGAELWRSDGRTRGTRMIKNLAPGARSADIRELTTTTRFAFFTVSCFKLRDSRHACESGRQLWRTDGTAAGTEPVPGLESLNALELTAAGDRLVFYALVPGPDAAVQMWITDGTAKGSFDLGAGGRRFIVEGTPEPVAFGHRILFFSEGESTLVDLWASDGTPAGTERVAELDALWPGVRDLTVAGDRAYFFTERDLWTTDGTEAGTTPLGDFDPLYSRSVVDEAAPLGNDLVFTAQSRTGLWIADADAGTVESLPQTGGELIGGLLNVGTKVFFWRYTESIGELWATQGTPATTAIVESFGARGWSSPREVVFARSQICASLTSSGKGTELWCVKPGAGDPKPYEIIRGERGSRVSGLTVVGKRLFFAAGDRRHGQELWVFKP